MIRRVARQPLACQRAAVPLARELAEQGRRWALFGLVLLHGATLRTGAEAWRAIALALLDTRMRGLLLVWLLVAPRTLPPFAEIVRALALRSFGAFHLALRVHRQALGRAADGSTDAHRVVVAFGDALAGQGEQAKAFLAATPVSELPTFYRTVAAMAEDLAAMALASSGERRAAAEAALARLAQPSGAKEDEIAPFRLRASWALARRGRLPWEMLRMVRSTLGGGLRAARVAAWSAFKLAIAATIIAGLYVLAQSGLSAEEGRRLALGVARGGIVVAVIWAMRRRSSS